jgi:hypothetical protein
MKLQFSKIFRNYMVCNLEKKIYVLLFLFFISLPVRAQNNAPGWVNQPNVSYPDISYLTVIGEGHTRKEAENSALSNLAFIFESRIKAETNERKTTNETQNGNDYNYKSNTDTRAKINVQSDQDLQNVKFGEYYETSDGKVKVLAYIDRISTTEIYLNIIHKNSSLIKSIIDSAASQNNKLKRFCMLYRSRDLSEKNRKMENQLRIIANTSAISNNDNYDELITERINNAASEAAFSIDIANDDGHVKNDLKGFINSFGLPITEKAANKISGKIWYEDIPMNATEKIFIRWHIELSLSNEKNEILSAYSQQGREVHINRAEAISRGNRTMRQLLGKEYNEQLKKMFSTY